MEEQFVLLDEENETEDPQPEEKERAEHWRTEVPWMKKLLPCSGGQALPRGATYIALLRQPRKKTWVGYYKLHKGILTPPTGFKKQSAQCSFKEMSEHNAAKFALNWIWTKHLMLCPDQMPEHIQKFLGRCKCCDDGSDCAVLEALEQEWRSEQSGNAVPSCSDSDDYSSSTSSSESESWELPELRRRSMRFGFKQLSHVSQGLKPFLKVQLRSIYGCLWNLCTWQEHLVIRGLRECAGWQPSFQDLFLTRNVFQSDGSNTMIVPKLRHQFLSGSESWELLQAVSGDGKSLSLGDVAGACSKTFRLTWSPYHATQHHWSHVSDEIPTSKKHASPTALMKSAIFQSFYLSG